MSGLQPLPALVPAMPADQQRIRDRLLRALAERPQIMGIVNVTPDSFYDGGRHAREQAAVAHAERLLAEGCAVVDIGGESTRPGATPVEAALEAERVLPVVRALCARGAHAVSIDTTKAEVAAAAIGLGAVLVNDVWGLQRDARMARVVAAAGAAVVLMHNRDAVAAELDIVDDVLRFFERSLDIARRAGIAERHILLDPGIGFGKTAAQSLACLASFERFAGLGFPLLLGASRKSFIGHVLGGPPEERLVGTLVAHLVGVQRGAALLRVHDVAAHRAALDMLQALRVTP